MKHVVIIDKPKNSLEKYVEVELTDNCKIYLAETEYSQGELDEFHTVEYNWILQLNGSQCFLADSDSGEDAYGYYSNYFDLIAEKAVFDKGTCVGFYLCTNGIDYSGRDRSSFVIRNWGYPGHNPFNTLLKKETHVFLFLNEETHKWKDWTLLKRDPKTKYTSSLTF